MADPVRAEATFDRRITPIRDDLAADTLKGRIDAPHYASGTQYQVTSSVAPLRRTPDEDGAQETQLLFGESITLYDEANGWGWGQAAFDGYVGYIAMEAVANPVDPPSHRVKVLRTYRYSEPDLKSAPLGLISLNAQLSLSGDMEKRFVKETRGGWVISDHIAPFAEFEADPVAVAERFLSTPYFWGGRESLGLDCSALVQNAYEACGVQMPRDTDHQKAWCETEEAPMSMVYNGDGDWQALPLQRGDVIYWPGHTALMVDADRMIHANGTHMQVTIDPLRSFAGKVATEAGPVVAIYRPSF